VIIAAYAVAVAVILTVGGFSLGFVHVTNVAKPLLGLLVVCPLRITLGGRSRLMLEVSRHTKVVGQASTIKTVIVERVPPVVADVAFAMIASEWPPSSGIHRKPAPGPTVRRSPLYDAVPIAKVDGGVCGLGLRLVFRHRPAGLLLQPRR
jgi:hypothetical protein